jgi:AraC-like DNA-binding protein/quercetin dioxygenase-like cupin family protein
MSRSRQSTLRAPLRRPSKVPLLPSGDEAQVVSPQRRPVGAPMVPSGDESLAVSAVAADFADGQRLPKHRHRRAQLVYAVEGVMTVKTDTGLWVVPPLRAVWLPPGVVHSIRMTGSVRMRTVYFDTDVLAQAATPSRPAVLSVTPLLREVIVRIAESEDDAAAAGDSRERLVAVLLDELVEAPVTPLEIPVPSDPRLRRIADALLGDPADARDLPAWARFAGIGERTLARLFPQQTGMTFVRWRQQVRLLRALERLALGEAVTRVAVDLGYGSTSAFVRLFRDHLGVTPGRYFVR